MKWPATSATALIVLTLALTGCDVRIDTPPPAVSSAEPQEAARQSMAVAIDHVIHSQSSNSSGDDALTRDAKAHLQAMGGVWQAPNYYDEPVVNPEDIPRPDPADAVREAASTALELVSNVSDSSAPLYGSLAVYYHRAGVEYHGAGPLAGPEAEKYVWPSLPPELQNNVIVMLDHLGYVWERQASAAAADDRIVMATTASHFRHLANELSYAAGLAGTDNDPRLPLYSSLATNGASDLTPDEVGQALMGELVTAVIAGLHYAPAQDREAIVQLAQYFSQSTALVAFPGLAAPQG